MGCALRLSQRTLKVLSRGPFSLKLMTASFWCSARSRLKRLAFQVPHFLVSICVAFACCRD